MEINEYVDRNIVLKTFVKTYDFKDKLIEQSCNGCCRIKPITHVAEEYGDTYSFCKDCANAIKNYKEKSSNE